MNAARTYKTCLLASVLLSVAAYAYAEYSVAQYSESSVGLAGPALPAIALGWWLTEGRTRLRWPGWLTIVAVLAIIARAVLRALGEGLDIAVFCEFLTLILVYKVWDHRHSRDHGQILTLCAFLAIGAILTGSSLLLGLLLAVFIPVLLAAVMMYQVRPDDRLALPARSIAADPGRPRLRRAFSAALVILWIGSVLVFIYFPREIGFGAFGRWGQNMLQTGYRDNIELGRAGLISESQETVLELQLRDGLDRVLGGDGQVYYLRGAVLDTYRPDTGGWIRAQRRDARDIDINPFQRGWTLSDTNLARQQPAQRIIQTITALGGSAGPAFAVWRPMEVTFLGQTGRLIIHDTDLTMQRPQSPGPFRYTVASFRGVEPGGRLGPSRSASFDSQVVRAEALRALEARQVPADPEQRSVEDDARAASAIEDYLRSEFSYTLEIAACPPGQDPIEWFLRTQRRGHCEYFASAMTAMCRSVGVDARVVTGYLASEWDPAISGYVVREANAHAWVESAGPRGGWQTYDPTPPADLRRAHQPPQDLLSRLRRFFDSAENRWATGVVGYDESVRRNLIGSGAPIVSWLESKLRAVSEARSPRAAREARAELRRVLLRAAGTALGLAALLLVAGPAWRWISPLFRRRGRAAPAAAPDSLGFYADLLRALARRKHPKPVSRPPLLHAESLAPGEPQLARHVADLANLYYQEAFGGRVLTPDQRREAQRLVREVAQTG